MFTSVCSAGRDQSLRHWPASRAIALAALSLPTVMSESGPGRVKTQTPGPIAQQLNREGRVDESLLRQSAASRFNISSRSLENRFHTAWVILRHSQPCPECLLLGIRCYEAEGCGLMCSFDCFNIDVKERPDDTVSSIDLQRTVHLCGPRAEQEAILLTCSSPASGCVQFSRHGW